MTNTKQIFDAIYANQQKLADTLSENMQHLMKLYESDDKMNAVARDITSTYMARSKEYIDSMSSATTMEEVYQAMTAGFSKMIATQMEVYSKMSSFYQNWFSHYNWKQGQEQFSKATEIYQSSLKAITDTTSANTQEMQKLMRA